MKRVHVEKEWPDSWKYSYQYDLEEIYGEIRNPGYVYAYDNRRRHTLRLLTEVLEPGARVLDVAAAQGNFTLALAEMGYKVTWNDLRADLAGYVQQKHERGAVEYAPGNAFELDFPAPFDGVLITEIIEHVAHPDEFLRKTAQLVKPGGYVLMTTPNGGYFRNRLPKFSDCADPGMYEAMQFKPDSDGHIFLLYPEEVRELSERAGLLVDEMSLFTNPLTNGHIQMWRLLKILPRGVVEQVEALSARLPPLLQRKCLIQLAARLRKPEGGGEWAGK